MDARKGQRSWRKTLIPLTEKHLARIYSPSRAAAEVAFFDFSDASLLEGGLTDVRILGGLGILNQGCSYNRPFAGRYGYLRAPEPRFRAW
jgi:hypothetical protein